MAKRTGIASRTARMARTVLVAASVATGGCASFEGQPRQVLSPMPIAAAYLPQAALERYYRQITAQGRAAERNIVIGIYMTAADANFLEFRRRLSEESRGSNFGLGSAFSALTAGATVSGERTANVLAAIASGVSGIQGRLSSEVYFERTLPALLAAMEADRTRIRTDIVSRMDEDDGYTLTEAFFDIARYETAGSLDNAIETITSEASELREQEQARFENVIGLGRIVAPAARIELRTLGNRIDALVLNESGHANLAKIAGHLDVDLNLPPPQQARRIMTRLRDMAADDPASLSRFVEEMQAQGVDLSQ